MQYPRIHAIILPTHAIDGDSINRIKYTVERYTNEEFIYDV